MGQKPVKTQDTPGFVLNYFLIPFNNDAIRLVEQGVAEPADIDLAIKTGMGYAMGPMELLDLIGMDTQKLLCEAMHGDHQRAARRLPAAGQAHDRRRLAGQEERPRLPPVRRQQDVRSLMP